MEGSLAHLALTNYPDQVEYIDKILETTGDIIAQHLEKKNLKSLPAQFAAAREVINLIKLPITQDRLSDVRKKLFFFSKIYSQNAL